MKKSIIALLLLSMLFSCKKDEPKQYSTWYVNGQKFTTNGVTLDHGKAVNILSTDNLINGFKVELNFGYLLTYSELLIACGHSDPKYCCFVIIYNSKFYRAHEGTLYAKSVNDKARFTMDETWFYSGNDSILVEGEFNEP